MKNPIQFKPDSYGRSMRASYCADYLEGLALTGIAPRWGDYGDFMSDLAIESNLQPAQDFHSANESGCDFENVGEPSGVRLIKDQIEERSDFLGKKYPFEIRSDGLYMKLEGKKDHRVYLALLALTLLHTSDSATKPSPSPEAFWTLGPVVSTRLFESSESCVQKSCSLKTFRVSPLKEKMNHLRLCSTVSTN